MKLNYGMVGGGEGGFIGDVHRRAIALDGKSRLVTGCFSRDHQNNILTASKLGLEEQRIYADYKRMAEWEGKRSDRIDFVVIATPNNTHYPIARLFLENGINVVCEKPFTLSSNQAKELIELADLKGLQLCLTYSYTGYSMVKKARDMIRNEMLGDIRFINIEYPQEWLSSRIEVSGNKQASWRLDPEQAGPSSCIGDIGTHVENLAWYITGLRIKRLSARLDRIVEGRASDDNGVVLVDYEGGAKGNYWCSQVAIGSKNGLRFRIFGSKGTLEWEQESPEHLYYTKINGSTIRISRGDGEMLGVDSFSRLPAGHPEGFFVALSNIYAAFSDFLIAQKENADSAHPFNYDFPSGLAGLNGVRFVEKCIESSEQDSSWVYFSG